MMEQKLRLLDYVAETASADIRGGSRPHDHEIDQAVSIAKDWLKILDPDKTILPRKEKQLGLDNLLRNRIHFFWRQNNKPNSLAVKLDGSIHNRSFP